MQIKFYVVRNNEMKGKWGFHKNYIPSIISFRLKHLTCIWKVHVDFSISDIYIAKSIYRSNDDKKTKQLRKFIRVFWVRKIEEIARTKYNKRKRYKNKYL